MKYLHIFCTFGFLMLSTGSLATTIDTFFVSGSNDPLVNGTYTLDNDTHNLKTSWSKGDYSLRWGDVLMTMTWVIENKVTFDQYYSNLTNPSIPAETGWECAPQAAANCTPPVVTVTPLPETLYVSGCAETTVSGVYTRGTNHEGWPRYAHGSLQLRRGLNIIPAPSWVIENDIGTPRYYFNNSYSVQVPELDWYQAPDGTPATLPVVTDQALPEKLIVSGTVDSFLNGVYTRGPNYSGYPLYIMGDYQIRQAWQIMTSVWAIENNSNNNRYYSHTSIGTHVPEYGWQLETSAGSPPSPPLVTEKELPNEYRVSGAGLAEVNGIYTRILNSTNHTGLVYEKDAAYFLRASGVGPMVRGYGIMDSSYNSYYYVESDSLLIPSTGWALDYWGTSNPPPPFVIPYNFPWPMFLPAVTKTVNP